MLMDDKVERIYVQGLGSCLLGCLAIVCAATPIPTIVSLCNPLSRVGFEAAYHRHSVVHTSDVSAASVSRRALGRR